MKLFDSLKIDEIHDIFNAGFAHLGKHSPLPGLKDCFITTGNVVEIYDINKIAVNDDELGLAIDPLKEKHNKIASVSVHFDEHNNPEFVQFFSSRYSFNQMAAIEKLNAYFPNPTFFSDDALENIIIHSNLNISEVLQISKALDIKDMKDPRLNRIIALANKGNKPECIINMLKDER